MFAPRNLKLLTVLLCAALFVLRIGGTHLHLCFDGSEAPVSLHATDSGVHHGEAVASLPHSDQDISVGVEALVKKSSAALDLLALTFAFSLLLFFLPRSRHLPPDFLSPPRLSPARIRLRPPLRGPPR
ncbi:MAG: hypothetical protein WDO72_17010 [Pseudomonadota bacterium]